MNTVKGLFENKFPLVIFLRVKKRHIFAMEISKATFISIKQEKF